MHQNKKLAKRVPLCIYKLNDGCWMFTQLFVTFFFSDFTVCCSVNIDEFLCLLKAPLSLQLSIWLLGESPHICRVWGCRLLAVSKLANMKSLQHYSGPPPPRISSFRGSGVRLFGSITQDNLDLLNDLENLKQIRSWVGNGSKGGSRKLYFRFLLLRLFLHPCRLSRTL